MVVVFCVINISTVSNFFKTKSKPSTLGCLIYISDSTCVIQNTWSSPCQNLFHLPLVASPFFSLLRWETLESSFTPFLFLYSYAVHWESLATPFQINAESEHFSHHLIPLSSLKPLLCLHGFINIAYQFCLTLHNLISTKHPAKSFARVLKTFSSIQSKSKGLIRVCRAQCDVVPVTSLVASSVDLPSLCPSTLAPLSSSVSASLLSSWLFFLPELLHSLTPTVLILFLGFCLYFTSSLKPTLNTDFKFAVFYPTNLQSNALPLSIIPVIWIPTASFLFIIP